MMFIGFFILAFQFGDLQQGQLVTIINALGAAVHDRPMVDSVWQSRVPLGQRLEVEQVIETVSCYPVSEDFCLQGRWFKPVGISGFVFSSDVTSRAVRMSQTDYVSILNMMGDLISKKLETEMVHTDYGEFQVEVTDFVYEQGKTNVRYSDGCASVVAEFNHFTIAEAYHYLMNRYTVYTTDADGNDGKSVPHFLRISGSVMYFESEDSFTEDLEMRIADNGMITVSSVFCD